MLDTTSGITLQHKHGWGPKAEEMLHKLWAEGLSAAEVAFAINKELGSSWTRNAIIGKVHRSATLEKRGRGSNQNARIYARGHVPKIKPEKQLRRIIFKRPVREVVPDVIDQLIPFERRKTVETIGMDDCRWPVGHPGEDNFFFCGAGKLSKLPYCAAHFQRSVR